MTDDKTTQNSKEAEEIKCQEKYGEIFDMVADPVLILDLKGKILDINKAVKKYGFSRSEMVGKDQLKYVSKKYLPKVTMDFMKVLSGKTRQGEVEIIAPTGKIMMEYKSRPLIKNNKIAGTISILRDITHKQTEEALKEAQRYTRGLIEANLDALTTISAKGKITDVNVATELITGIPRKEIIGTDFSNYFTVPDKARKGYQQVFQNGYVRNYPLEIKHRDGRVIPVLYNASVYKDTQGNVVSVFAAARDITKRKQKEEELKDSESRYKYLLDNINEIALIISPTGKIIFANQRACRLGGYKKSELEGTNMVKFLSKDSIVTAIKDLKDEFMGHHKNSTIVDIKKKDGEIRRVDFVSQKENFIKKNGKTVGLLLAGQDITDKLRADKELRESEARWRSITENSSDIIMLIDQDEKITFINRSISGLKKKEVLGENVYDLIPDDFRKIASNTIKNVFKTGKPSRYETECLSKKGDIQYCDVRVSPIFQKDKVVSVVSSSSDITESKQAEKKIKESEENFRVLYETSADAIFILEPPLWKFTSANLSAVNMFGLKNEKEFVSLEPHEVSPKYQPDGQLSNVKAKKNIMKAMKDRSCFFEWTHKRKNGEDFFVTVLLSRVEGKEKKYLQATVRDISEQKESKRKLTEKLQELGKMNDLMVNRELKMIELKREINEFCKLLEKKKKYNNKNLNI